MRCIEKLYYSILPERAALESEKPRFWEPFPGEILLQNLDELFGEILAELFREILNEILVYIMGENLYFPPGEILESTPWFTATCVRSAHMHVC